MKCFRNVILQNQELIGKWCGFVSYLAQTLQWMKRCLFARHWDATSSNYSLQNGYMTHCWFHCVSNVIPKKTSRTLIRSYSHKPVNPWDVTCVCNSSTYASWIQREQLGIAVQLCTHVCSYLNGLFFGKCLHQSPWSVWETKYRSGDTQRKYTAHLA